LSLVILIIDKLHKYYLFINQEITKYQCIHPMKINMYFEIMLILFIIIRLIYQF